MALSAMTRNLARFVLVVGGVLVSLVLLMSIGIAVAMRNILEGPQLHDVAGRSVSGPAAGVAVLLLLIAAVVAARSSFNTRRGPRESLSAPASRPSPSRF